MAKAQPKKVTPTNSATRRPDKIRVFQSPEDDQWYVTRKASNGRPRMTSEGYTEKQAAIECAEADNIPGVIVVEEPKKRKASAQK